MNKFNFHMVIVAALLSGCVSQQSAIQVERPMVDFEIHSNMLIVEGYVNGKWAKFLVDTGASISLLDYNQSKKYKFEYFINVESRLTGFGGKSRLMNTSDVAFKFRGLTDQGADFLASDLSGINRALSKSNQKVLGIIGSDFLKAHGAIIDYQLRRIVLTTSF
jgi:hypothetical protein